MSQEVLTMLAKPEWVSVLVQILGLCYLARQIHLAVNAIQAGRHDMADRYLFELNKYEFEHPDFCEEEWITHALQYPKEVQTKKYKVYAKMCINYAETLFKQFGQHELRASQFKPVVQNMAKRHKLFIEDRKSSYDANFVKFMDQLRNEN